jgi:predicted CoA-binding protein
VNTRDIVGKYRRVAIVGLSTDPTKVSHERAQELIHLGYDVVPVHPKATEILGRRAYAKLGDITPPVEVVDVFRPAEEAPAIARDAIAAGAKVLWLQRDIKSDEARRIAEEGGLIFVEDRCFATEAGRIRGSAH